MISPLFLSKRIGAADIVLIRGKPLADAFVLEMGSDRYLRRYLAKE
jgi:hypothetical protein